MKKILIICYLVLTNIAIGQTLKLANNKTKFSISKNNEVTINLKDGSVIIGKVLKLSEHEITIKTIEKERKAFLITDMLGIEKCSYILILNSKNYWKRCKIANFTDITYSFIK